MERIVYNSLFSLFHHNLLFQDKSLSFDTKDLYQNAVKPGKHSVQDLADKLYNIVGDAISNCTDSQISLTLTGGMDSRVILSCLLKAGIKPNCLTYGHSKAKDVFFAKELAKGFGLNFHNAVNMQPKKDWYYKWVIETIKRDNGNSHLHRAHRTAAIAEHAEQYCPSILFTGHMGGEGLRGFTYNNYFSSSFFESVNEGREKPIDAAKKVLGAYFIKTEHIDYTDLLEQISGLSWMRNDKETNEFFFLYDLVAKIHHAQDIRIFKNYVPKVVPVYLQKSYLDMLFSSQHHFLGKKKGLLGRLSNPFVHCKLIEYLYPKLLDFPMTNGYKPKEYLKGLWYYVPMKIFRDIKQKKKFAPTFSYGKWYYDFVKEHSQNISPDIWEFYDRKKYMNALNKNSHGIDEGYWHKFSNPIYFDLVEKLKKEASYNAGCDFTRQQSRIIAKVGNRMQKKGIQF